MGRSKLSDIINSLNLDQPTEIIRNAYKERYNGNWWQNAYFAYKNNKIKLFAPEYTKYILYGSRGVFTGLPNRKAPPPVEPIQNWIAKYNNSLDVDKVRYKIYWYGTKANDFISQNLPKIIQSVKHEIVKPLTTAILIELQNMRWKKG